VSNPFANGPQGPAGPQPQGQGQAWGQPQGQPQGQPPYGQVPPQAAYYAPQPQQRPKAWRKWLGIAAAVVVVIAVVAFYATRDKDSATDAKVGDCITAPKDTKKSKTVDCESTDAAFRVINKFGGTSQTSKCETEAEQAKGYIASFYWSGSGKGVLCLTLTKNTTLEHVRTFESSLTQEDLDAIREDLVERGIPGVK
jgi:hypothetical protein